MIGVHQNVYGGEKDSELQTNLKSNEQYTILEKKENMQ